MAMEKNATPSGTRIEYRKFVCAVGETNHNKYWNVGLYDSDDVEIHFGRIGVTESQGVQRGVGRDFMEKKIREKEKGKMNKKTGEREPYTEIDAIDAEGPTAVETGSAKKLGATKLQSIAKDQIEHSSPVTAKLIDWLAQVNRHTITDATGGQVTYNDVTGLFCTPLGIIPPAAIGVARGLLVDIAEYVVKGKYNSKPFKKLVDQYLTIIPHNLGMKWSPETFLPDVTAIQKENAILDALDAAYVTATTQTDDTKDEVKVEKPKVFETKLIDVDNKKTIERIERKFSKTKNSMHRQVYNMKIENVWEVDVAPMTKAFEKVSQKIGNVMTLWHGTQASNLLSILKVGLVIPPSSSSHCTGRLYGDGVYASDQSTKALNYATSFWGGNDAGRYFMFLVDFAMGKTYTPQGRGGVRRCPKGYDSTFAKAGQSGVMNNEMIVYATQQTCLKFLCEFSRKS